MATTKQDVRAFIRSANGDDLNDIVQSIKDRRAYLDAQAQYEFQVGDSVKFDGRSRGLIRGTIEGRKGKKFLVNTGPGLRWRVSGSMLKRADDPKPPPPATDDEF